MLLVTALVSSLTLQSNVTPSAAQASSLVCIAASGTTNCPSFPPTFTGGLGQTISVAVNIENSPAFNGVDIAVDAAPAIISGTSIDTSGNAFQAAGGMLFILAECINNQPVVGNCTSHDGPGIVHYAASSNVAVTGGHMFNINYFVQGTGNATITYQTGCSGTSNTSLCVTVVNGSTIIPENVQTASFVTGAPPPDFSITANPNGLSMNQGSCASSSITLFSINGFNGTVTLSSPVSPPGHTATLQPNSVTLLPQGSAMSTLNVCTTNSSPTGSYTVTVTGTSGSISHSTTASVSILGRPDFAISTNLPSFQTTRGSTAPFLVILTSENNFGGTINLAATVSPLLRHGPTTLIASSINLCAGCSTTTNLLVIAPHSVVPGTYTVTVTATSGSLTHSVSVIVTITQ